MNRAILVLAAICAVVACSSQRDANEELREKLWNGKVTKVEILQIPEDVFMKQVTPERIAQTYHAKLELRASSLLAEVDALDRALADTECKPSTQEVDVRTAIVFYDANDSKLKGFYYGVFGKSGQVDATPCDLGKGLYYWATERLPQPP